MEAARGKGNRSANVSLEFYSNDQPSRVKEIRLLLTSGHSNQEQSFTIQSVLHSLTWTWMGIEFSEL